MINCDSYFNTKLIRMFGGGSTLKVLEVIDRFLHKDAINVPLSLEDICYHKKVTIRHYKEALRFLQDKEIIFNWKCLLGDKYPHIIVPDDFYLVNPKYIRHINKTQFKKYLKNTKHKLLDINNNYVVNEHWAVNLIPIYSGDEYGGFYIEGYDIITDYEPNTINKPVFSI